MLILAIFFAGPAFYNIALSFQELSLFDLGKEGEWVGFANFAEVLSDPKTPAALFNTALPLTFVTVVVRLVLGLGARAAAQRRRLQPLAARLAGPVADPHPLGDAAGRRRRRLEVAARSPAMAWSTSC